MLKFVKKDHCESNEIVTDQQAGGEKTSGVVQSNFL